MKRQLINRGIAAWLCVLAVGVQAQDTLSVSKNYALDEVVVTGTRNETDVQELCVG